MFWRVCTPWVLPYLGSTPSRVTLLFDVSLFIFGLTGMPVESDWIRNVRDRAELRFLVG